MKKIRELIDKLNYYTKLYDEGHPAISDREWDDLYFELVTLEGQYNIYCEDSPTQKVDYRVVNELKKVTHNHPMLSLDKTKDMSEVYKFLGTQDFLSMCKMDGLTMSLRYLNGQLVSAETRGDGVTGEDVLHNALVIKTIPKKINYQEELIVDGEIICTYFDFEPFKQEYVHPRNFAAGSIRLLDSAECAKRNLTFVAWDVIRGFEEENSLWARLNKIANLGFTIVPCVLTDDWDAKEFIQNQAKENGYPIDGLVFKFDNIAYGKIQGATGHHLKNAIAFKFYDNSVPSKLKDIEWSMGRTGVLTPVAIFDAVEIDFTFVSRASLHNVSIMQDLLGQPYKGQPIEVAKMNMIIPQIVSATKGDGTATGILSLPVTCPVCGEPLELTDNNGVQQLVCANPNCAGKLLNRLDHFCGKDGLDIKQLSIASLNDLINWGYVNTFADIFQLEQHKIEWMQKPGWSRRSVERLLSFIAEAKNTSSEQFISAIGIPLIGKGVAKQLVNNCGDYFSFREKVNNHYSFSDIYGFGVEKENAILNFDYTEADEAAKYLRFIDSAQDQKHTLDGVTVVITGSLTRYKNRNDLIADIEACGGKVVGSVSKKTNYLINNDITSVSGKNKMAKEFNIPIITEQEFVDKFIK